MRLTLRTLLAYLDDTLPAGEAKKIGEKVAESPSARELIDRIRKLTRKRSLAAPTNGNSGSPSDANVVSDYLSDTLAPDEVSSFEESCLKSDSNLAEVSACHQILTLLLSEPVRVPPTARQRMYRLVKGPGSQPNRKPGTTLPLGGEPPEGTSEETFDADATLLLGVPALAGMETGTRKVYPILLGILLFLGMMVSGYLAWPKTRPAESKDPVSNTTPMPTKVQIEEGPPRETAPFPRIVNAVEGRT